MRSLLFKMEDLKALGIIDPGPERTMIAKTLTPETENHPTYHPRGPDGEALSAHPASGEAFAETRPDAPSPDQPAGHQRSVT